MAHYFCPTCGGVDTTIHACQTPGCEREGQDLQECNCETADSHKKSDPTVARESIPEKAEDQQ